MNKRKVYRFDLKYAYINSPLNGNPPEIQLESDRRLAFFHAMDNIVWKKKSQHESPREDRDTYRRVNRLMDEAARRDPRVQTYEEEIADLGLRSYGYHVQDSDMSSSSSSNNMFSSDNSMPPLRLRDDMSASSSEESEGSYIETGGTVIGRSYEDLMYSRYADDNSESDWSADTSSTEPSTECSERRGTYNPQWMQSDTLMLHEDHSYAGSYDSDNDSSDPGNWDWYSLQDGNRTQMYNDILVDATDDSEP